MNSKQNENEKNNLSSSQPNNYHIYNWGFSKYGQTGLDNCQFTDEPNKLFIPLTKEVISLSCGEFNSSIIFKDNKTYLYGLNTFGQLGNGSKRFKSKKLSIIQVQKFIIRRGSCFRNFSGRKIIFMGVKYFWTIRSWT